MSQPSTASRWSGAIEAIALIGAVVVLADTIADAVPHVAAAAVAVALGIVAANLGVVRDSMRPTLVPASRKLIRGGVVLLGFQLTGSEIVDLGPQLIVAVAAVSLTFLLTRAMGSRLGVSEPLSLLVATGFSICGVSAVAAMETTAGADDDEVAAAVALVTLCGTIAIFVLPGLGSMLGLHGAEFGAWAGASVHDVAQVVAVASARGDIATKAAIAIKLARVALLVPLVVLVSIARSRPGESRRQQRPQLPLFLLFFAVAMAIRSTGHLAPSTISNLKTLSATILVAGLAAVGTGVRLAGMRAIGLRPLVLAGWAWLVIMLVSLAGVTLTS